MVLRNRRMQLFVNPGIDKGVYLRLRGRGRWRHIRVGVRYEIPRLLRGEICTWTTSGMWQRPLTYKSFIRLKISLGGPIKDRDYQKRPSAAHAKRAA